MAAMIVRLLGRFVYALPIDQQGRRLGLAYAIAIDPKKDPALQHHPKIHSHRVFMAAPRKSMVDTGKPPDFNLGAGRDRAFAEHEVWNLHHCHVDIGSGVTPFAIHLERQSRSDTILPMLEELIEGERPRLLPESLKPAGLSGLVTSTIALRSGTARLYQADSDVSDFAPFGDLAHHSPKLPHVALADLIEVTLPDGDTTIAIKRPDDAAPFTLEASPDAGESLVVNISNLCTAPIGDADLEFAGFYGVVHNCPNLNDRLVPVVVPGRFGEDCYKAAGVTFRE